MKQFVFLYPVDRKFNWLIQEASYPPPKWLQEELSISSCLDYVKCKEEKEIIRKECLKENEIRFREFYKEWFNNKIGSYRREMFGINWFVYDGDNVCNLVDLKESDNIFEVGVSWDLHHRKKIYPCQSSMLEKIKDGDLTVAGFMFSDCVQRFSKRAVEQKRNISIDEDLTDLAQYRKYLFSYFK